MNELVSVIIPVYNSEKYIGECIDSFLGQTYPNIEMILIDDGSSDGSAHILEQYRDKHQDRISVYMQENAGVAVTRNRGIQYARGTYLMFADNDDYVEPDYVEIMVREIRQKDADMVICSCRKVDEDHRTIYEQRLSDDTWSRFRVITPWARIMRRDFILEHHILFGEYQVGEDSFFSVTAYNETDRIEVIPYIGYNWVQHPSSVSNTVQKKGATSPLPFLEGLIKRNPKMKHISKECFDYFVIKFIVWNLYYISDSVSPSERAHCCEAYFGWLKKKFPDFRKNTLVSPMKPRGEEMLIRILVWMLVKQGNWGRKRVLDMVAVIKKSNWTKK